MNELLTAHRALAGWSATMPDREFLLQPVDGRLTIITFAEAADQARRMATALIEPAATFTTLRVEGRLRGCCGTLEAVRPLAEDVTHSAFRAAFRDVRFDTVGKREVDTIRLEVSVLSPLEPTHVSSEAELLQRLMPGIDGLVIVADGRRATFLPKVWEMLPDPRQFLLGLKTKCGLAEDYWSERLEFQRYRTTSYAESIT